MLLKWRRPIFITKFDFVKYAFARLAVAWLYIVVHALFIVAPMLCGGSVGSLFSVVVFGVLSSSAIVLLR